MKVLLKEIIRSTFEIMGYRITRTRPANRFQAMDEMLLLMRDLGFSPKIIIDAGANVGAWTQMARHVYPDATIHMIEAQSACAVMLKNIVHNSSRTFFHQTAITEPGVTRVRMLGGGEQGGSTGARVAAAWETGRDEVECLATTLDALFADKVVAEDRVLLKLDLEGHEEASLRGASRLLELVEVVVTELQFYQIQNNGRARFTDILNFFRGRNFELYDFASLSQRPRDMRLRMGDVVFVRGDSSLVTDRSWE